MRNLIVGLATALIGLAAATPALAQRCDPVRVLRPNGGPGERFGSSVAMSGDRMVVGSPEATPNAADVYLWNGSSWAHETTLLKTMGGQSDDEFGISVAIDGNTAVIGAGATDVGANRDQGAAYVFVRHPVTGVWTWQATLTDPNGKFFGRSVSVSGDLVIVGSAGSDVNGVVGRGAAYVFTRAGTSWSAGEVLVGSIGGARANFGAAVAISATPSGTYAVVGAPDTRVVDAQGTPQDSAGLAFFFSLNRPNPTGPASWQESQIVRGRVKVGDNFGCSVALSGESAIIGADQESVTESSNAVGTARIYIRSGGAWVLQTVLWDERAKQAEYFASSVAISGNTAVVGSYESRLGSNNLAFNYGAAYVFRRTGTVWSRGTQESMPVIQNMPELSRQPGCHFGRSVAVSGSNVAVGARFNKVNNNTNQGSVWIFPRAGSGPIGPANTLVALDGATGDFLGRSVAVSGSTAIVGAPGYDRPGVPDSDEGAAYIFERVGGVWTQKQKLEAGEVALPSGSTRRFGESVAILGDTAVVGASNTPDFSGNNGALYVFTRPGPAGTWTRRAKLVASDGSSSKRIGFEVAMAANPSGPTGTYTIVSGSRWGPQGFDYLPIHGSVTIFTGSGSTWTQQGPTLVSSDNDNQIEENSPLQFGHSVAIDGDTVLVGAIGWTTNNTQVSPQGAAYIFTRTNGVWSERKRLTASNATPGDNFGQSVALNGGIAFVGAPASEYQGRRRGTVFFFRGSGATWTEQSQLVSGSAQYDSFGGNVALWGNRAVIGWGREKNGSVTSGAYLFTQSSTGWSNRLEFNVPDLAPNDYFSNAIAIDEDIVVFGAVGDDVGSVADAGSARVFDLTEGCLVLARAGSPVPSPLGVLVDARRGTLPPSATDYNSLFEAIANTPSGGSIEATPRAFEVSESIDTLDRTLSILCTDADLNAPWLTTVTLANGSSLRAEEGNSINIFGPLQIPFAQSASLNADSFLLGAGATLVAQDSSLLTVNAPDALLQGQTGLGFGSNVNFNGSVLNNGSVALALASTLGAEVRIDNSDTFSISEANLQTPLFVNSDAFTSEGASVISGSFDNNEGALTTLRPGLLRVDGSLINRGAIVGSCCDKPLAASGTPTSLDVGGTLTLAQGSRLHLPFAGAIVRVGGDLESEITDQSRFDLSLASLEMSGQTPNQTPEQNLEVMSRDVGPNPRGLERSFAGHYPIGTLVIGPVPSTVQLLDTHDNDGRGQAAPEAIYVDHLRIDEGSRLANAACRIYYRTLVVNGTVDAPENLIPIGAPCPVDLNFDALVTDADFEIFIVAYDILDCADPTMPAGCPADFNSDAVVDDADFSIFVVAYDALVCP